MANAVASKKGDMIIEISFPRGLTSFNKQILEDVQNKTDLEKIVYEISGEQMHIKYITDNNNTSSPKTNNNPLEGLGIDINIID